MIIMILLMNKKICLYNQKKIIFQKKILKNNWIIQIFLQKIKKIVIIRIHLMKIQR